MATTSSHVVRISEVGDCVQQVIDDLNAKLWAMNQRGHFIEMPEELTFDMVVLKEFEALTSTDTEISEGTEIQGGYSTESQKSSQSGTERSDETRKTDDRNSHVNKGKTTTISEQS